MITLLNSNGMVAMVAINRFCHDGQQRIGKLLTVIVNPTKQSNLATKRFVERMRESLIDSLCIKTHLSSHKLAGSNNLDTGIRILLMVCDVLYSSYYVT